MDTQLKHLDVQLQALDQLVQIVRTQNGRDHEYHAQSVREFGSTVKESYSAIAAHLSARDGRIGSFTTDATEAMTGLKQALSPVLSEAKHMLADLRTTTGSSSITEYAITGQTPPKTCYTYPRQLARTGPRDGMLLNRQRPQPSTTPTQSPSRTAIFNDPSTACAVEVPQQPRSPISPAPIVLHRSQASLREVHVNVPVGQMQSQAQDLDISITNHASAPSGTTTTDNLRSGNRRATTATAQPAPKRQHTGAQDFAVSLGPGSKLPKRLQAEGRENVPPMMPSGRALRPRVS